MLSKDEFVSYGQTTVMLANEAAGKFDKFVANLDMSDMETAHDLMLEYAQGLIEQYGGAASLNAAEFFEKQTGIANAITEDALDLKSIDESIRYSIAKARAAALETGPYDAVSKNISRQTKNYAHRTMIGNAKKHHVMFARVPMGAHTCAFCTMLASRGFVYYSRQAAGELMQYHNDCDCQIVAGVDSVEGYDPDSLYEDYKNARNNADGTTQKDILAQMRKDLGVK